MDYPVSAAQTDSLDPTSRALSGAVFKINQANNTEASARLSSNLGGNKNTWQSQEFARTSTAGSIVSVCSSKGSMEGSISIRAPARINSEGSTSRISELGRMHAADASMIGAPLRISICVICKEVIPTNNATIRCLICSSADKRNVVPNLCHRCYLSGASQSDHEHDVSFYASDSDPYIADSWLPREKWIVRRNASKRLWYEHIQTRYKTYMQPMTAICEPHTEWHQKIDSEGGVYYENAHTGVKSRRHPVNLPSGWREAKDPDGKLFFVHDQLEVAAWCRPGEQPPLHRPSSNEQSIASAVYNNTAHVVTGLPNSNSKTRPAQTFVKRKPVSIRPSGAAHGLDFQPSISEYPTFQSAAVATVNLIDPSDGGVIRSTRIAAHMAGKGVRSVVKSVKENRRVQDFARGTGITLANGKVKRAWRKAATEVDARNGQDVWVRQSESLGNDIVLDVGDALPGDNYIIEYDNGVQEHYDANGQLLRITEPRNTHGDGIGSSPFVESSGDNKAFELQQQNALRPIQGQKRQQTRFQQNNTLSLNLRTRNDISGFPNEKNQRAYVEPGQNAYVDDQSGALVAKQSFAADQNVSVREDQPGNNIVLLQSQCFIGQEVNADQEIGYEVDIDRQCNQITMEEDGANDLNYGIGDDIGEPVDF